MILLDFLSQIILLLYIGFRIPQRLQKAVYFLAVMLFVVSTLFKIMHWPYGSEGLSLTTAVCMALAGFAFVNNRSKSVHDYLLIMWLFLFALYFNISMPKPEYKYQLLKVISLLKWVNLIYALILYFKNGE